MLDQRLTTVASYSYFVVITSMSGALGFNSRLGQLNNCGSLGAADSRIVG